MKASVMVNWYHEQIAEGLSDEQIEKKEELILIPRAEKRAHDKRVRMGHVNAIKILKSQILKTAMGFERNLLKETEAYHLAKLNDKWFSR